MFGNINAVYNGWGRRTAAICNAPSSVIETSAATSCFRTTAYTKFLPKFLLDKNILRIDVYDNSLIGLTYSKKM